MRSRSSRRSYGWILVLGAAVLLLVQWKLDLKWGTAAQAGRLPPAPPTASQPTSPSAASPTVNPGPPASASASPASELIQQVTQEAESVGQTTDQPEVLEQHLNAWGRSLNAQQVRELRDFVFRGSKNDDQVAVALDLLGRSNQAAAVEALTDYVLATQVPASATDQETFRLLALDGLIDQSRRQRDPAPLRRVQSDSADALVVQRARQALGALQGQNPWPDQMDDKALRDLLTRQ